MISDTGRIARLEAEIIGLEQVIADLEDYIERLESEPSHLMFIDMGFGGFGDN
jgi:hypothetical protein